MQESEQHSRLKQIAIIIACLLGAVAVGWGAIVILKTLGPARSDTTKPSQILSAAEVIKQYATTGAIAALSADTYNKQTDADGEATVVYKSTTASYVINTPTKHSTLFSAKNLTSSDDIMAVQQQTTAFMEQHGLSKINNVGSATSPAPVFVTYENDETVCQLRSMKSSATEQLPGYHQLDCVDKAAIREEYTATDTLLTLFKKDNNPIDFTESLRTTQTEANKSLAILTLSADNTSTFLLFAAIDNNWSYIGNLDSGQESNGKYAPSPEVRQALTDPKWGDFLIKNVK